MALLGVKGPVVSDVEQGQPLVGDDSEVLAQGQCSRRRMLSDQAGRCGHCGATMPGLVTHNPVRR